MPAANSFAVQDVPGRRERPRAATMRFEVGKGEIGSCRAV